MTGEDITAEQIVSITAFVDIEAPPPNDQPTAHIIFGTNQVQFPGEIVVERYHRRLAPLIITTGGVNRHTGIVEGHEFYRYLSGRRVPDEAIRCEDQSSSTWKNVELALPFLREALESGLTITAVCKWYHRRAIHALKTLLPGVGAFHVITWDPIYSGAPITRDNWPLIPGGRRRVIREWKEVSRCVADGTFHDTKRVDGAWR